MKIGYSFWGYLGDLKFDPHSYSLASTPDGNAFYSWSIIKELQDRSYEVFQMMPDRDKAGMTILNEDILFHAWASEKRKSAYSRLLKTISSDGLWSLTENDIFSFWDAAGCSDLDFVLHEWRMPIEGRNTEDAREKLRECWQPDLFLQQCVVDYCRINDIKLVLFDLDYKLEEYAVDSMVDSGMDVTVLELGSKWSEKPWSKQVQIPFDFTSIYEFKPKSWVKNKLVYVGNRYERDWCIDKYIPKSADGVVVHGNWDEGGRDSKHKWPTIMFEHRLQTLEMQSVYSDAAATVLLAKEDYCKYGFMTARVIEAVFYGTVPLFIEEFGNDVIERYAGEAASYLTVHDVNDVIKKMNELHDNFVMRVTIINNLREKLKFMDVKNFVDELLSC